MTSSTASMTHISLANDKLENVLRLIRTSNVGPVTFFQLLQRYHTAANALDALPELSRRGGRKKPLTPPPLHDIENEITQAKKFGAQLIMYGQPEYPALLHTIPDPPPVISVLGSPKAWQRNMVGMVGARNASASGCHFGQKLAGELGAAGVTVVSGLARGIDSYAHKGALHTGTVGVIAVGIDNIYPPENKALYETMRERGAIISEQPFGSLPFAGSFPGRNRIIAGMSLATVVVEASPKSGSLITAKLALDYNREVLAVPGSPLDPRSRGCNQLLKQGATIAESAADILSAISHAQIRVLSEPTNHYQDAPAHEGQAKPEQYYAIIDEKISSTPIEIEHLIEQTRLPAEIVTSLLLEMELGGKIYRNTGGKVSRRENTLEKSVS